MPRLSQPILECKKKKEKEEKMKKKSQDKVILSFLVVVLLIAGTFAFMYPLYIGGEGFTIRSITEDRVISNAADLQQANFIIDTVFDGSNNKIVGYLTEEQFKQKGASVSISYPLELSAESVNEYAIYQIYNQKIPVASYARTDWDYWPFRDCPTNTEFEFKTAAKKVCVYRVDKGLKGNFYSKSVDFDVKVNAKSHGETATATLSNREATTVNLRTPSGEYIGTAKWTGSLQTGQGLPSEHNFAVILPSGSNYWKAIKVENWNTYMNTQSQFKAILQSWKANLLVPSLDDIDRELNTINIQADWLLSLSNTQIMNTGQTQTKIDGNDAIKVNLRENNLEWGRPNVVWYVKAYWLGAYIPVGEPRIISTTCDELYSGEFGYLKVKVKNIASVSASFDAAIIQPCDVIQEGGARLTIPAGGENTFEIRVSQGSANLDKSGQCQVKVYDTNNPDNYDTAYFNYRLKKARECDPGKYKGEANCIYHCSNAGVWELVKCCANDEQLSFDASKIQYDGWYCKAGAVPTPVPDTCYEECCEYHQCGPLDYFCALRCQISCWFYNNILYFIGVGALIVLWIIFKIFRKISPPVRAIEGAYRMARR